MLNINQVTLVVVRALRNRPAAVPQHPGQTHPSYLLHLRYFEGDMFTVLSVHSPDFPTLKSFKYSKCGLLITRTITFKI